MNLKSNKALLMSVLVAASTAVADTKKLAGAGSSGTGGDKVLSDVRGTSNYWSEGMLVGYPGRAMRQGLIFKTMELEFLLGTSDKKNKEYPALTMKASTYNSDVFRVFSDLDDDQRIVLRYEHPHHMNPFHLTESKYWVTSVEVVEGKFENTASFKKFNYNFVDPRSNQWGRYGEGSKKGKIMHVSRWGHIGKTCTIYIHEGGLRNSVSEKEKRAQATYNALAIVNNVTSKGTKMDYIHTENKQIPNINSVNVFSEEGCVFAEEVAKYDLSVNINYSEKYIDIWNAHASTVHSIRIAGKGRGPVADAPAAETEKTDG